MKDFVKSWLNKHACSGLRREYEFLRQTSKNDSQLIFDLKRKLSDTQDLLDALSIRLQHHNAAVISIQNNNTFIFAKDMRISGNGDFELYVLSPTIYASTTSFCLKGLPYLYATFRDQEVSIDHLYCDVAGTHNLRQGYGTMLVTCLINIAKRSHRTSIHGKLSEFDAKTKEEEIRRNRFFEETGFTLAFPDGDDHKNGYIHMSL